jgi:hypothetical protein
MSWEQLTWAHDERIVTQMFQSEQIGRELIVQGQLQMATLFSEVLKLKNS